MTEPHKPTDDQHEGGNPVERDGLDGAAGLKKPSAHPTNDHDWTVGLKRLYDTVLNEPMPDNFRDLLSKLDNDTK